MHTPEVLLLIYLQSLIKYLIIGITWLTCKGLIDGMILILLSNLQRDKNSRVTVFGVINRSQITTEIYLLVLVKERRVLINLIKKLLKS